MTNVAQKTAPAKSARLEARIKPDVLALLKHAAEIEGRSLTDFVVQAAMEAAERRIERTRVIKLSLEDQVAFAEALLNPPEPTEAMKRAFRYHRALIQDSE
jgi:uncharacterized protein (DUF1778 family)